MKNIFRKKKRVLFYGDYSCHTGFATVTTNMMKQLLKKFAGQVQFDMVAINWYGDRLPDDYDIKESEAGDIKIIEEEHDGEVIPVKKRIKKYEGKDVVVYSAYHHDGKEDIFGRTGMLSMLKHFDYDLLFMIQDVGIVAPILQIIRTIKAEKKAAGRKQTKVMYYFPIDGPAIEWWFNDFDVIDRLIAYTEYTRERALFARNDLNVGVILHGVNTNTFKPLPYDYKMEFRKSYFGDNADKFIICNVNRNQYRKDIPTTILAIDYYKKEFKAGELFLYLHMNPMDMYAGWNLYTIMQQTSLIEGVDYMFMPKEFIENPPEPAFVNCIYNASDLSLTTTTGEGFGLSIIESMAAGIPVLAPLHTSIKEISKYNRIYTIEPDGFMVDRFDSFIRPKVAIEDVCVAINSIRRFDPEERKQKLVEAFAYASSLNWDRIGHQWIEEFKKFL